MSQASNFTVQNSLQIATNLLADFANQSHVQDQLAIAFGDSFDTNQGMSILTSLVDSQLGNLPQIEIRPAQEINQARGAYSLTNNTIYLSEQFVANNSNNIEAISKVILAEIGHYLDAQANSVDARGDEGDIFASLVVEGNIEGERLTLLQAEDDRVEVTLDGSALEIEQAGTIYVNSRATGSNNGSSWANAYTNLQTAITAAAAGDEIWVAKGTYKPSLTGDREVSFKLKNGVKMYGGFAGNETTIAQKDSLNNPTILSGDIGTTGDDTDNSYHVVDVSNTTSSSILNGFTISNGNADASSNSSGGGILSEEGNAVLSGLTIANNSARFGGGIYAEDSQHQLNGIIFVNNTATSSGGGLYQSRSGSILNNISFNGNYADNSGGAIYNNRSDPRLSEVRFTGNQSGIDGGAIYNSNSDPNILTATFLNNTAVSDGGAIYNARSNPTINRTIFKDNIANDLGGAIYNNFSSDDTTVVNSLFTGNKGATGGSIYNDFSDAIVINSTFYDNLARTGSAIASEGTENDTPGVSNSIIWNNESLLNSDQIANIGANTIINNSLVQGGYEGENIITTAPQFVNPLNYDFRLKNGSPAVAVGNNAPIDGYDLDLAGNPRLAGTKVDFGAYEGIQVAPVPTEPVVAAKPEIIYVNAKATAGSSNGTSWANAYTNLQTALKAATFGTQIWVAAGTYKPSLNDRTISFKLNNGVEVYGGFAGDETSLGQRNVTANATILSGDIGTTNNTSDNSYHVVNTSNTSNSSILDGFTISSGNADESNNNSGGGIYGVNSHSLLKNLTVSNNQGRFGGGIYSSNSSNQLTNVGLIDNTATSNGGGLYELRSGSSLSNVTFSSNQAGDNGGAIYSDRSTSIILGTTFSSNQASDNGGAIYNSRSNPVLNRVTFGNNAATDDGGAIYNSNSSPNLSNAIFRANTATTGGAIFNNGAESNGLFVNSTYVQNQAESGAAIYTTRNSDEAPRYFNSIIYRNTGAVDSAPIVNEDANTTVSHSIVEGGYNGEKIITTAPNFVNLTDGNLRLRANSPAINAGLNEIINVSTDLANNDRIINKTVDLGAYEFTGSLPTARTSVATTSTSNSNNFQNQSDVNIQATTSPTGDITGTTGSTSLIADDTNSTLGNSNNQVSSNKITDSSNLSLSSSAVSDGNSLTDNSLENSDLLTADDFTEVETDII